MTVKAHHGLCMKYSRWDIYNIMIIILLCCVFLLQKYGVTALAWAACNGHEQVVDVLLKAGANPDIQDKVTATII